MSGLLCARTRRGWSDARRRFLVVMRPPGEGGPKSSISAIARFASKPSGQSRQRSRRALQLEQRAGVRRTALLRARRTTRNSCAVLNASRQGAVPVVPADAQVLQPLVQAPATRRRIREHAASHRLDVDPGGRRIADPDARAWPGAGSSRRKARETRPARPSPRSRGNRQAPVAAARRCAAPPLRSRARGYWRARSRSAAAARQRRTAPGRCSPLSMRTAPSASSRSRRGSSPEVSQSSTTQRPRMRRQPDPPRAARARPAPSGPAQAATARGAGTTRARRITAGSPA